MRIPIDHLQQALRTAALGVGMAAGLTLVASFGRLDAGESFHVQLPHRGHVAEGAVVQPGDLLLSLDTSALDARIAGLKARAETARIELADLSGEAMAMLAQAAPHHRERLATIEQRLAELGRETRDLGDAIAAAEQDLSRAPAGGRVQPVAPGTTVFAIASSEGTRLERLREQIWRTLHRGSGS